MDFFGGSSDGRLYGDSKLNFQPHPDDAAAAEQEGLPDGTPRDLLHILAKLSRAHGVDWEISHDYSDGPVGYIRGGEVDGLALSQIGSISDVGATLGNLIDSPNYLPDENPPSASRSADLHSHEDDDEDDDEDDGRAILAFRPKGP
ncbi:MAG TPA: hypothetical protein VEQ85_00545 [Lacipirellulaceae bacterium]|nr:hypothetical protein [Lacipirellulaceae bacterium]